MPSLALVRRRAALIAVCAVRALSTTSERLRQLGRHASIEIAPRQATRYAELAKARPSAPRTVFVNFVDTEDEHFAAVEAACAVLKAAETVKVEIDAESGNALGVGELGELLIRSERSEHV